MSLPHPRRRLRASALAALAFAVAPAAAQGPGAPAVELKKLAPMIGTWEGSGVVSHGPGMPSEDWTARSSARWVLGGHFVRENVRIEMASAQNPLEFTSLYGWDRENGRYVQIEVGNVGTGALKEVHFTTDGKMIIAGVGMMMGMPTVERWVSELADGAVRFTGDTAQGAGAFYEHVKGSMKRTSDTPAAFEVTDAAFMPDLVVACTKELGKLSAACGDYEMKGWFVPGPDQDKMHFTGTESVRAIFGGSVIELTSKGEPTDAMPAYEGQAWMTWDDHQKCYRVLYANNLGEVAAQEGRLHDDVLVFTAAHLHRGQPACLRGVLELNDDGAFDHYVGHSMIGTNPPAQSFEATYTKK